MPRPRAFSALAALKQLGARYDLAALQPPDPAFAPRAAAAQRHPSWHALRAWCLQGASPLSARMTVAVLESKDATGAHILAQTLCLERDGSLQLLACRGVTGRLMLRLTTKLHDMSVWREHEPGDAWDAGFVRASAAGLQALARFQTRRSTLLVAHGLDIPALRAVCALLHARQRHSAHALRLLLLPAAPGLNVGWPVTRIVLNALGPTQMTSPLISPLISPIDQPD